MIFNWFMAKIARLSGRSGWTDLDFVGQERTPSELMELQIRTAWKSSLSAPASGEALPMEQEFKQGYRMHRILSKLNRLDIDRLDDADRERVETARDP